MLSFRRFHDAALILCLISFCATLNIDCETWRLSVAAQQAKAESDFDRADSSQPERVEQQPQFDPADQGAASQPESGDIEHQQSQPQPQEEGLTLPLCAPANATFAGENATQTATADDSLSAVEPSPIPQPEDDSLSRAPLENQRDEQQQVPTSSPFLNRLVAHLDRKNAKKYPLIQSSTPMTVETKLTSDANPDVKPHIDTQKLQIDEQRAFAQLIAQRMRQHQQLRQQQKQQQHQLNPMLPVVPQSESHSDCETEIEPRLRAPVDVSSSHAVSQSSATGSNIVIGPNSGPGLISDSLAAEPQPRRPSDLLPPLLKHDAKSAAELRDEAKSAANAKPNRHKRLDGLKRFVRVARCRLRHFRHHLHARWNNALSQLIGTAVFETVQTKAAYELKRKPPIKQTQTPISENHSEAASLWHDEFDSKQLVATNRERDNSNVPMHQIAPSVDEFAFDPLQAGADSLPHSCSDT